jgi:hypothetical protein
MKLHRISLIFMVALAVAACASIPSGPSVMVLPGTGKSFDQFRADDFDCRQFAHYQVGGKEAEQAAGESVAKSAAVGTAVGAAAGAALGGQSGAAAGAGTGLLFGTAVGTGEADRSSYDLQRRYDHAFIQCMYARGHKVPVSGRFASSTPSYAPPPPPPPPPR